MRNNMGIIHQPRPRAPSPTFAFVRPPDQPVAFLLPTPTSTPPPNAIPKGTHLTIPGLVESDDRYGSSNALGRALDVLANHSSKDAVLTLGREQDDEYMLSARPFDTTIHKMACEELWSELDKLEDPPAARVESPETIVPQSTFSYLTPPSSPEPVRKRDMVPTARVDRKELDLAPEMDNLAAPNTNIESGAYAQDLALKSSPFIDEPANDGLEYPPSGCDDFDWSCHDDNEGGDEDNEMNQDDNYDDEMIPNNEDETILPPPPYMDLLNDFSESIPDLTLSLDMSSFSEWPIAKGGFGDVWKGSILGGNSGSIKGLENNKGSTKPVAVKRLTAYADGGEEGKRRILKRTTRELFIWSSLHHANVLPLLGTCSFRGGVGIVSEWQDNGNATAWVKTNPHVDRLELCEGICAGLEYLHQNGVVHGDLRGANVLISPCGTPRLIDFGLASIVGGNSAFSVSSTLAGTVRWMAPELQVTEGQGTTPPSDMFAFGMTMLELHTGLPPFATIRNDIAVLLKYQHGERPPRPSLPPRRRPAAPRETRRQTRKASLCAGMDDDTWGMVQECWAQDPAARPCAISLWEYQVVFVSAFEDKWGVIDAMVYSNDEL
ncbi:Tyrosine-protein kinase Src-2 [Ceratobasidium theobromae]|uniref:Tyrosine-protein kinase Src-2 n=1 Tax=Ceratobasidium theobromae TaxID=1582974 RepID=A0A5N5QBY2_9AGAM|nr:Tyrosine-protein kinase Src-2 [Ceratobasidium theobromae]